MTNESAGDSLQRVFVAVDLSEQAFDDLIRLVAPRWSADGEMRWIQGWHLTLAYLGEVTPDVVARLKEELAPRCARRSPFRIMLKGAGVFPRLHAAKVLYVGLHDPAGQLGPLARDVRAGANHAGAAPLGSPFHPHVTVGRYRRPTDGTGWLSYAEDFSSMPWRVEQISLFESHLFRGPNGEVEYDELARFPLLGPELPPADFY